MITTIVDTDVLLALFHPGDLLHLRAVNIFQRLTQIDHTIYILPTTISEFALIGSYKIGMAQTQKITSFLMGSEYEIKALSTDLTTDAVKLYEKQTSKEESLFDCFVMIAAKKFSVNCILSFDKGYTKNKFTLIEDWLKKHSK